MRVGGAARCSISPWLMKAGDHFPAFRQVFSSCNVHPDIEHTRYEVLLAGLAVADVVRGPEVCGRILRHGPEEACVLRSREYPQHETRSHTHLLYMSTTRA